MDPITAAIVAGLAAGATKVSTSAILDAYAGLKAAIARKFGAESEVAKAVEGVEARPDSDARKSVLHEEVAATKADQDPDILRAAQALLEQLKAQPGGVQCSQTVSGSGAAAANHGVAAGQGGVAVGGNIEGGLWRDATPRPSDPDRPE
jgi:hypothetical protein